MQKAEKAPEIKASGGEKEKSKAWTAAECAFAVPEKYGFVYEYAYDKGSDSSCVYIHRFKKGRDFFDLRVLSGAETLTVVACVNGEYYFPDLKKKYKKRWRAFRFSRLFKRITEKDVWQFYADALKEEAKSGALFGIKI